MRPGLLEQGAVECLFKPFSESELLAALRGEKLGHALNAGGHSDSPTGAGRAYGVLSSHPPFTALAERDTTRYARATGFDTLVQWSALPGSSMDDATKVGEGSMISQRIKQLAIFSSLAVAGLAAAGAYVATASSQPTAPVFVEKMPAGYRDWRFVSLAREEGTLDDIRAMLGNDVAMKAYRDGVLPFPQGTMIARLAYSYEASEENNKAFGKRQSFVAGHPKNGVQIMIKDPKKYAATGGWGYGHFEGGQSADETMLKTCFPCHQAVESRDFVFTRYAP